nr:protein m42 [Mastomys natalensis cytomegalovirus 3]WEG69876.1 protein m42 [Mastomys natalensis cytomegalovirus 3]WEG70016.1 protein m42 [Mastomys natalensis cytomegalovirus 3]WEG70156.1 protein m42 [Mastomys natalensis cytomegalovirus 3]WEG70296.1 protein m42 [Mastomys natalensis cytomegalovirus 3]
MNFTVEELASCPEPAIPSYLESVLSETSIHMRDINAPPSYDSIFCESGTHNTCIEAENTGEISEPREQRVDTRMVLEALDKEFRWTAISVGLSLALLVVLVLIIVIVAFPREGRR